MQSQTYEITFLGQAGTTLRADRRCAAPWRGTNTHLKVRGKAAARLWGTRWIALQDHAACRPPLRGSLASAEKH